MSYAGPVFWQGDLLLRRAHSPRFSLSLSMPRRSAARSLRACQPGAAARCQSLDRFGSVASPTFPLRLAASLCKSAPEQGPIRVARAESVTAVIRLSSLLRGKLEFRKFVIASPRVVFRRGFPEPAQTSYGLGAARLALALSAGSPFADVELRDPVLFFTASANGAYERVELSRVRLSKDAVSSVSTGVFVKNAPGSESALYALDVTSSGFEVSFRGQCAGACQTAFGSLRLRAALSAGAGKKILAAVAPWERPDTIALFGELNLSRRRAALDNAAISFGDHAAQGSLALDMTGVRPRLEGTIAYDTLDVTPAWISASGSFTENLPLAALPLARRENGSPPRFRSARFSRPFPGGFL